MTKSLIEQELEKYVKEELINIWKVKQVIQKAKEELKKKRACQRGYPHICQKNPDDCDYMVVWEDIEEVMGK